ncbi:MAG: hypothetical protein CME59_21190 [Halioglobus sp.]|nr:hypothetical protein [Halioglobus sp.]|tara:strand:- start:613 stop:933 length:321 start_codon:yes stop_codon:yes gene_type:complete
MRIAVTTTLLSLALPLVAQEARVSLHSTVSGNREQPRVVYIVPWRQPGDAQYALELHNTIAAELFAPMDRDEFNRDLAYGDMLRHRAQGDGRDTNPAATGIPTNQE